MRYLVLFVLAVTLASCGGRQEAPTERPDEVTQLEEPRERRGLGRLFGLGSEPDRLTTNIVYGALVPEILSLELDRTADGVIILATTRVGPRSAFDVSLRPLNNGLPNEEGLITFEFRYDQTQTVSPPIIDGVLTAGEFVSTADLENVRGIQVFAASNSRSVRR